MKRFPSGGSYSPTMVANGSKRHPLHAHYSRLHRNPEDETLDLDDVVAEATKKKEKGKAGRKPLSASEKARRAAAKTSTPKEKKESQKSEAAKIRGEISKLISALASASKTPAKKVSESAKAAAKARKEEAKKKADAKIAKLRADLKAAKEAAAVKVPSRLPGLRIQPDLMAAIAMAAEKKAAAKAAKGTGEKKARVWTASQKAKAAATRASKKGTALVSNPGKESKKSEGVSVGPYKISLLKNPVTDFSIGGVKVLPAVTGAAGAIALIQLVQNLPWVDQMQNGTLKSILPSAVAVAAGAAGLYFTDKYKHTGLLRDASKDLTAFGIFSGLNAAVGVEIRDLVDKIKSKPAMITAPAQKEPVKGGMFAGGGWSELSGYHLKGQDSGYAPFQLTGESGYFPDQNLQLNGYHMAGDANSAQTMAAMSSLSGGAFKNQPVGGLDMTGFQD